MPDLLDPKDVDDLKKEARRIRDLLDQVSQYAGVGPSAEGDAARAIQEATRKGLGANTAAPSAHPYVRAQAPRYIRPPGRLVPPGDARPAEPIFHSHLSYPALVNALITHSERGSYWTLGDAGHVRFLDHRGERHGIAQGDALQTAGPLVATAADGAVRLGAPSGHIDFGDAYGFEDRRSFTLGIWIKPTKIVAGTTPIMSNQQREKAVNGWAIALVDGFVRFERCKGTETDVAEDDPAAHAEHKLLPRRTYFVVASYDKTEMRVYVNGELRGRSRSALAISRRSGHLLLGAPRDGYHFEGIADEAFIADGAAAADQDVSMLYRAGIGADVGAREDEAAALKREELMSVDIGSSGAPAT